MTKKYILFFDEVTKDSIDLVGGKGANLGELVKAGFPVPNGYCIHVGAYKTVIRENGLQNDIDNILVTVNWENPVDIEEKSLHIRNLILKSSVPGDLHNEIIEAYYQLSGVEQPLGVAVAVRSSATAEDLPGASFAGQQETYLNIRGEHEVLEHVKHCWASLWTARAMAYRRKQNYDHDSVYLSVIIQRMVEAEVAGVAFTVNPLNGSRKEMLINSSYGFGEVVVSGTVTPDILMLNKKNLKISEKQLGTKEKRLKMSPSGRTQLVDVPLDKRKEFSLSDSQTRELGKLILQVEEHYQSPQDVEWAFANGKLFLLQARPVTTQGSKVNPDESIISGTLTKRQKFMLDDLIEHYPEAPTPLDYAVVITSYQALLNNVWHLGIRISGAEEIIRLERDGRIALYPPKIRFTLRLLSAPAKLLKAVKISASTWQNDYQLQIGEAITRLEEIKVAEETNENLIEHFKEIFKLAQNLCELRFYNFMSANMLPLAGLSLILRFFCPGNNRPSLTELVTTGLDYKTTIIDRELNRLAVKASGEPGLKAAIADGGKVTFDDLKKQLLNISGGEEFLHQLEDFLRVYGYRTEKMYQPFTGKAWLEDPDRLLVIIRAALQDPLVMERKTIEMKRKEDHVSWVNRFEKTLKAPFRRLFRWSYEGLRANHVIREDTLFSLERLFTAGRKIMNELGMRLANGGYINVPEDIVYLTREEIPRGISGQIEKNECRRFVSIRKKHFTLNQTLWKKALLKLAEQKQDVDMIQGLSGSPGLAEGPVRVIMNVNDFGKLEKGDILVCPYTDPTWTPLFGIASAVVADTGGPLSHAAIVAREYGIPAVLGTKLATSFFIAGEIVVVDGSAGTVYKKG